MLNVTKQSYPDISIHYIIINKFNLFIKEILKMFYKVFTEERYIYITKLLQLFKDLKLYRQDSFGKRFPVEKVVDYDVTSCLHYLPIQCLENLLNSSVAGDISIDAWLLKNKELGNLDFEPFVINDGNKVSLMLEYNVYLQFISGVSFTLHPTHKFTISSSLEADSVDVYYDCLKDNITGNVYSNELYQSLYFMSLCVAGSSNSKFRECCEHKPEIVQEFAEAVFRNAYVCPLRIKLSDGLHVSNLGFPNYRSIFFVKDKLNGDVAVKIHADGDVSIECNNLFLNLDVGSFVNARYCNFKAICECTDITYLFILFLLTILGVEQNAIESAYPLYTLLKDVTPEN